MDHDNETRRSSLEVEIIPARFQCGICQNRRAPYFGLRFSLWCPPFCTSLNFEHGAMSLGCPPGLRQALAQELLPLRVLRSRNSSSKKTHLSQGKFWECWGLVRSHLFPNLKGTQRSLRRAEVMLGLFGALGFHFHRPNMCTFS